MKTTLKHAFGALFVLICFAPPLFAQVQKNVPEALSPLWLGLPVAGMFAYTFIRSRKK